MTWLKQSTAVTLKIGPFVDDTDGKTAETALTISQADVRLSKNGGDIAQKNDATACTHDELGYYDCPLNTTDTGTLGALKLMVHEGGALPVWHEFMVVTANVWDSLFGADKLQVDAQEIAGAAVSTSAAQIGVDVVNWKGSAAPANTGDAFARLGAPAGASVSADIAAVKSDTGAIKAKTDNLPADPADDSDIDAQLAAIAGYIDTEVAAILAAVDTEVAAIKAKTDNLPASPAAVGSAMTLASGAITAAVVATGAIDADALAADAVAEIADAVWDETTSGHTTAGSTGKALTDANNGTPPTAGAIADAVWDETAADHSTAGTTGKALQDAGAAGTPPSAADIADAVWDEQTSGHADVGSTGAALTAAGSAGDPWSTALPGAYGAGTAGKIIGTNLDATVSSRAEPGDAMALEADAVSASALSAAAVDEILDEVVEGTITLRQALRIVMAGLAGRSTGGGTSTLTFRDVANTKARISATVDASGNRTTITLDGS